MPLTVGSKGSEWSEMCLLEDGISLWPLLAYLANIKGLCPDYTATQTTATITTLSTSSTTTSSTPTNQSANTQTSSLAVSTTARPSTELNFNNTGSTIIQSTTTTLSPCPAYPLMCLTDGKSPISYCPCIDPRQQKNRLKQHPDIMIFSPLDNAKFARIRTKRSTQVKAQSD
ncbi:hypothetical protein GQX74_003597 [Glossina fuscipes]|nr:hypothetical protein GQX74_003597 [Glossina fuscipes]